MGAPDAWRITSNQLNTPRRSGHRYKSRLPKTRLQQYDESLSTLAVLQHARGGDAASSKCSVATGTTDGYSSSSTADSSQPQKHRSHHIRQFQKALERRRGPSSCKVLGVASPTKAYRRYDDYSDSDFHSCSETEPPTLSDSDMDNNTAAGGSGGGGFFHNSHREATSLISAITGFTAFHTEEGESSSISGPSSLDEYDDNRSDRARRKNNTSIRTRNSSTTRRSRRATRTTATTPKTNATNKASEHQRGRSSPSSVSCKKSSKSKRSKKRSSSKSRRSSRSKSKTGSKSKREERKTAPLPNILLSSFTPSFTTPQPKNILSSAQSVAASAITNPFENSPVTQAELEPDMRLLADAMNLDSNTRTMLAYYDARTIEDFCLMSDRDFYDLLSKAAGMNRALPPLQIRKVEVLRDWVKELMNTQKKKNQNTQYMDDGIPTLILGCRTGSRYESKSSTASSQPNLPRDWSIRLRRDLPKLKFSLKAKGEGGMTLLSLCNYANLWPIRSLFC